LARVAVGANNTVLIGNSAASAGVSWAAATALPALAREVLALTDTAQSFTGSALGTVSWGTEGEDSSGYHGAGSSTITFQSDGLYVISARAVRASSNWGGTSSYLEFSFSTGGDYDFPGTGNDNMCATLIKGVTASDTMQVKIFNGGATANVDSTFYMARLPLY
jgi:hypothetical protein